MTSVLPSVQLELVTTFLPFLLPAPTLTLAGSSLAGKAF